MLVVNWSTRYCNLTTRVFFSKLIPAFNPEHPLQAQWVFNATLLSITYWWNYIFLNRINDIFKYVLIFRWTVWAQWTRMQASGENFRKGRRSNWKNKKNYLEWKSKMEMCTRTMVLRKNSITVRNSFWIFWMDLIRFVFLTELPETSFTRSISNPEAVMRRRRQQKLEKKLQQFRSKDGGPDTGNYSISLETESNSYGCGHSGILLST